MLSIPRSSIVILIRLYQSIQLERVLNFWSFEKIGYNILRFNTNYLWLAAATNNGVKIWNIENENINLSTQINIQSDDVKTGCITINLDKEMQPGNFFNKSDKFSSI